MMFVSAEQKWRSDAFEALQAETLAVLGSVAVEARIDPGRLATMRATVEDAFLPNVHANGLAYAPPSYDLHRPQSVALLPLTAEEFRQRAQIMSPLTGLANFAELPDEEQFPGARRPVHVREAIMHQKVKDRIRARMPLQPDPDELQPDMETVAASGGNVDIDTYSGIVSSSRPIEVIIVPDQPNLLDLVINRVHEDEHVRDHQQYPSLTTLDAFNANSELRAYDLDYEVSEAIQPGRPGNRYSALVRQIRMARTTPEFPYEVTDELLDELVEAGAVVL